MYSLQMPGSPFTLDVGFEAIEPVEVTGSFLDVTQADLYFNHVIQALLKTGVPMQKEASIFAWPLGVAEKWATKDISNTAEMAKQLGNATIDDEAANAQNELFLVFSSHQFNYKQALLTYNMAHAMAGMAKASLDEEAIEALRLGKLRCSLNTAAYGVWTMDGRSLNNKYERLADKRFPDVYLPKSEAIRIIAPVNVAGYDGIDMPTSWPGGFKIRNGGHIAIAVDPDDASSTGYQQLQRDVAALHTKVADIETLFLHKRYDGMQSRLDIYGIEPGYVESNYRAIAKTYIS